MAHLLDDEDRRVLVERLVDRHHHAHLHERLDDLGAFYGHARRELAHGDRLADLDVAHDGRRRALEHVLRVEAHLDVAAARLLLAPSARHAVGDVQRVIAVGGLLDHSLLLELLAGLLGFGTRLRLLLGQRGALALVFGASARLLVGGGVAALLFFDALLLVRYALLSRLALALLGVLLGLRLALDGGARVLLGAAHCVELFLLLAGLLLEDVAFDVGALLTHLDVDRARPALVAAELELARRLAVQRDLARRGLARILAAVRLAKMRQQLELRVLADDVVGAADLDAGFVELNQQAIDRYLEYLREIRDGHFRHQLLLAVTSLAARRRTNVRGRP